LHRRIHDTFNKKDYRILNSDLNKKSKLRSDEFKDQSLKRTFLNSEASLSLDLNELSSCDLKAKAEVLAGNWEPLKKKKQLGIRAQPLEINNPSHLD